MVLLEFEGRGCFVFDPMCGRGTSGIDKTVTWRLLYWLVKRSIISRTPPKHRPKLARDYSANKPPPLRFERKQESICKTPANSPFIKGHTSLCRYPKIAKILRFQTVSSWFLYFHENFRKLLFLPRVNTAGAQFYFISFSLPVFAPIWQSHSPIYRR